MNSNTNKKKQIRSTTPNLDYCLQFLRNAGERMRAIGLCMQFTGMNPFEAGKHVDGLKARAPLSGNRELVKQCPYCNVELHFDTPKCPICHAQNLITRPQGKTLVEVFAEEEARNKRSKKQWGHWTPPGVDRPWDAQTPVKQK